MTDPSLALQKLIRTRLAGSAAVTSLVDPHRILDRGARPEGFPCIILGEGQTVYADDFDAYHDRLFVDLHIWIEEPGLAGAKEIAGAVREALRSRPWCMDDHVCRALTIAGARFLRDPDGTHGHGIVSVMAIVQRRAA